MIRGIIGAHDEGQQVLAGLPGDGVGVVGLGTGRFDVAVGVGVGEMAGTVEDVLGDLGPRCGGQTRYCNKSLTESMVAYAVDVFYLMMVTPIFD